MDLTKNGIPEVGLTKIIENGKQFLFLYRDCEKDQDGWVDVKKFLPHAYDLCFLKIKDLKKTIIGWWGGAFWDGLRFDPTFVVTHWQHDTFGISL